MEDRIPTYPNRMKLTHEDGASEYVTLERADEPTQAGTPLNKLTLFDSSNATRYGAETPSAGFTKLVQDVRAVILASGWSSTPDSNGWYTNQVTVDEMRAVYNPVLDLVITSAPLAEDERAAFGLIMECETFDGYVIAKALEVPEMDINVRFVGV